VNGKPKFPNIVANAEYHKQRARCDYDKRQGNKPRKSLPGWRVFGVADLDRFALQ